jgi:hypothetical protein
VQNNNPVVHGKKDNKRIWSLYNESLVRRMKDILDLKDIENYRHDLRIQNMKKNGRPFMIPDKIIEILARIRAVFNASFRSLESYMRIFQKILGTPGISYSSIFRRIRRINARDHESFNISGSGFNRLQDHYQRGLVIEQMGKEEEAVDQDPCICRYREDHGIPHLPYNRTQP